MDLMVGCLVVWFHFLSGVIRCGRGYGLFGVSVRKRVTSLSLNFLICEMEILPMVVVKIDNQCKRILSVLSTESYIKCWSFFFRLGIDSLIFTIIKEKALWFHITI